jgi:predicted metal-dependent hydrolase
MMKGQSTLKQCITMIKGRPLKYRVRRNSRARKLRVWVSSEQGVVVTLPHRAPMREVTESFVQWEDWLEEKVNLKGAWNGPVVREYATGSSIHYLGVAHKLDICVLPLDRKRSRISIGDGILKMELPAQGVLSPRPALEKFLKNKARQEFHSRVEHWSQITQLFPERIMVGDRTSRWGSCSSTGTLSFCYRLILAPPHVMDAIVVHELCHLKYMNHSKKFWALVEQHIPEYEEVRQWLADHASDLKV